MTADQKNPIVVFGGTGWLGRHTVASLLKKGVFVRVLSRNATRAREILGNDQKVEIMEGDLTDQACVRTVLRNARAVVISVSAFSWNSIRKVEQIERDGVLGILEELKSSGIQRVVYISAYDVRLDTIQELNLSMPYAHIKHDIEQALADSTTLNWTVLGAAPSTEIYFAMIRGNKMTVPGGGPPALPYVSPVDVGEIAAQSVLRDDLKGMRFRMTGPEAISFQEAAARIGAATGRSIRYQKMPLFPMRVAGILTRPFNPFIWQLYEFVQLMNGFPEDLVQAVPVDHERLLTTFDYEPTTLEEEAKKRMSNDDS